MVEYAKRLYVSSDLKSEECELRRKLSAGEKTSGIYVAYLNEETGREETMRADQLTQGYYARKKLTITALLTDKDEALLYLATMAVDALKLENTAERMLAEPNETDADTACTDVLAEMGTESVADVDVSAETDVGILEEDNVSVRATTE